VPKPSGTPGNITVLNWAGFKGAVTYSFDDSNDSQIQNYSTLQALGVPFTFFMWTGKSEASNSVWATALKDGHEIGNHTQSHDPTGHCTTADITSATAFIQNNLKEIAWTMAAPNGAACYEPLAKPLFFINRGVSPAQPVLPKGSSDPTNRVSRALHVRRVSSQLPKAVKSAPNASEAPSSSGVTPSRLTQNVGNPNHLAPAASQPPNAANAICSRGNPSKEGPSA
jgi:hypothetical protein